MPRKKNTHRKKKRSPETKEKPVWPEATLIVCGVSLLFAFGLNAANLDHFQPKKLIFGALIGAYLGFAALPYFDSKKFEYHPWIYGFLASLAALAGVIHYEVGITLAAFIIVISFVVGVFAPHWVKYITL